MHMHIHVPSNALPFLAVFAVSAGSSFQLLTVSAVVIGYPYSLSVSRDFVVDLQSLPWLIPSVSSASLFLVIYFR
eukprot:scaffold167797_cov20-Tisochrysis_lutea.AAC.2